jgi:hypothetical protein
MSWDQVVPFWDVGLGAGQERVEWLWVCDIWAEVSVSQVVLAVLLVK